MIKVSTTREIIEKLQKYEEKHGVGAIKSIGTICSGSRDIDYIFHVEDSDGNETHIEISSVDKNKMFK